MAVIHQTMLAAVLLLASSISALARDPVCTEPKVPLTKGQGNMVIGEEEEFSSEGQRYNLNIYSGFAQIQQDAGTIYCVRHELVNLSSAPIKLLYWPDGAIVIESLAANDSTDIGRSVGSTAPTPSDMVLGAFKAVRIETRAYKQAFDEMVGVPRVWLAADEGVPSVVAPLAAKSLDLKSGEAAVTVGADFGDSQSKLKTSSDLRSDADSYHFSIAIERTGEGETTVIAPFAMALDKASSPSEIPAIMKAVAANPLYFDNKPFVVERDFPKTNSKLFLIEQPITLVRASGRVCFLAPAYSPEPIDPSLLSCQITKDGS